MKNCARCENAIYDYHFCEFTCRIYKHKIAEPDVESECEDYEKRIPKDTVRTH